MPMRRSLLAKSIPLLVLAVAWPMLAQVNTGELRLKVTDPGGLGLKASVTVSSEANQYSNTFTTSDAGQVALKALAYGIYLVRAESQGFTATTETLEVRSALPAEHTIKLALAPVNTSVQVTPPPH